MTEQQTFDVIIVGGGILGWMTARRLLEQSPGVQVALFEANQPGSASVAAGAMIAPFSEVTASLRRRPIHHARLEMAIEAAKRWRTLLESAQPAGLISGRGTVLVRNTVSSELEDDNFHAVVESLKEKQASFERPSPGEVPGLCPGPHERAVECVFIPSEFSVDTDRVLAWLHAQVSRQATVSSAGVAEVLHDAGRVTGVRAMDGRRYAAPKVLLAGGVWARALLPEAAGRERTPPVYPGAGVALHASQPEQRIENILRTPNRSFSCGLHVLPRAGNGLYIGATNNPWPSCWVFPPLSEVEFLVMCATRQVNLGLARSALMSIRVGNRPISVDGHPLVGRTELEGLWLATGTYREGLTLSPVLAELLGSSLLEGKDAFPAEFQPVRRPRSDFTHEVAVREAVDNFLAVAAEHETRLASTGWTGFMRDTLTERVDAVYRRLPQDFVLSPDLAGLAVDHETSVQSALVAYLRAWR